MLRVLPCILVVSSETHAGGFVHLMECMLVHCIASIVALARPGPKFDVLRPDAVGRHLAEHSCLLQVARDRAHPKLSLSLLHDGEEADGEEAREAD